MKRILYSIAFIAVAAAALVSCSKESNDIALDGFTKDQIVFLTKSADEPATKATGVTEVTIDNLISFNVIAINGGNTAFTSSFSKDGSKFKGGQYWPASEVNYTFYASNASTATGNATGNAMMSAGSITVTNTDQDVVAAYLPGATYKAENTLTFNHIFAQLGTVTMKAPEGYDVTNLRVKINPIYSGTYNMSSSSWSSLGAASGDTYIFGSAAAGATLSNGAASTSGDNDIWLLPGTYVVTASYTISKGTTYTKDFTKSANVTLLMGNNNNLILPGANHDEPNIPVPDDISDIVFTVSVTPWNDNDIPVTF